jgi:hypothetical protein
MMMPVRKPWLKKVGKRKEKTTVWESWSKDRQPVPIDQIRREGIMLATRSFQNSPPPKAKKTAVPPSHESVSARTSRSRSLKKAKTEPGHHVRVRAGACMETSEVEKKRGRDANRLLQRPVKSGPNGNKPRGNTPQKIRVNKADPTLQVHPPSLWCVENVDPVLGLHGKGDLNEIGRKGALQQLADWNVPVQEPAFRWNAKAVHLGTVWG